MFLCASLEQLTGTGQVALPTSSPTGGLYTTFYRKGGPPKPIAGCLLKEKAIKVSHEIIYADIRADKQTGGEWMYCRHSMKYRRRPVGGSIPIPERVGIEERPKEVDGKRFGDFEMDTIIGKGRKGAILTIHRAHPLHHDG